MGNKSFWSQWQSFCSGVLLLCVAGLLQYMLADNNHIYVSIASILCSVFGGILISKSFAIDSISLSEFSPRIESVTRNVALIASQIAKITSDENRECNLIIAQLSQISHHLSAVTTDLEAIGGKCLDPQVLRNTSAAIGDIVSLLEDDNSSSGLDRQKLKLKLTQICSNLSVDILDENVECPYCKSKNVIKIGAQYPYSAMPFCSHCGEQFHANRQKDGKVITRKRGMASTEKCER